MLPDNANQGVSEEQDDLSVGHRCGTACGDTGRASAFDG